MSRYCADEVTNLGVDRSPLPAIHAAHDIRVVRMVGQQ
jgi:hypothetical protein